MQESVFVCETATKAAPEQHVLGGWVGARQSCERRGQARGGHATVVLGAPAVESARPARSRSLGRVKQPALPRGVPGLGSKEETMEVRTLAVPLCYGPRGGAGSLAGWGGTFDRTGTEGVGRVHGAAEPGLQGQEAINPMSQYKAETKI